MEQGTSAAPGLVSSGRVPLLQVATDEETAYTHFRPRNAAASPRTKMTRGPGRAPAEFSGCLPRTRTAPRLPAAASCLACLASAKATGRCPELGGSLQLVRLVLVSSRVEAIGEVASSGCRSWTPLLGELSVREVGAALGEVALTDGSRGRLGELDALLRAVSGQEKERKLEEKGERERG